MTLPANSWPFIPEKIWVEIDIFLYSGCCLVLRRIKKLARNSIENDREKEIGLYLARRVLQWRIWADTPPPQVLEHGVHEVHSLHDPS
jgi:hypothetical protein